MNKILNWNSIKNWFLTFLLALGGVLDFGMGLMPQFVELIDVDEKYIKWIRFSAIFIGYIVLKLQPPSTNPDKLQTLVFNAEREKM